MLEMNSTGNAGKQVQMVNVGEKPETRRESLGRGIVRMSPAAFDMLKTGSLPKGNVLAAAQVAGIMAAKKTSELIPLCHPLLIDNVSVDFELDQTVSGVIITSKVTCTGRTGVEMEALTAVAVAALTIYDMCKSVDAAISIESIRLLRKSGGKSGTVDFSNT